MAVYIARTDEKHGYSYVYHMIADTPDELHHMARRIRATSKNLRDAGTASERYTLLEDKQRLAVAFGAIRIEPDELTRKVLRKLTPHRVDRTFNG